MNSLASIKILVAVGIVGLSLFFDLKSKKIPNKLVLGGLLITCLTLLAVDGFAGASSGAASFATAFIVSLPLYLLKILGGGDIKLYMAISPVLPWDGVITVILASLVWGALLGIFRVLLSKKGIQFLKNIWLIALRVSPAEENLTKIPFSAAILFGLSSYATMASLGVSWL